MHKHSASVTEAEDYLQASKNAFRSELAALSGGARAQARSPKVMLGVLLAAGAAGYLIVGKPRDPRPSAPPKESGGSLFLILQTLTTLAPLLRILYAAHSGAQEARRGREQRAKTSEVPTSKYPVCDDA